MKYLFRLIPILLGFGFIFLLIGGCPFPQSNPNQNSTRSINPLPYNIIVYFPEWGIYAGHNYYYPQHVPFELIALLQYGFLEIKKSGTNQFYLNIIDPWASLEKAYGTWNYTERMGNIRELKYQRDSRNPNVKLLFSVGGWSRCGYFSEMAYTQTGPQSFIQSCIQFIRTYGYDGIDIDWEWPGVYRAPSNSTPGDQGNPVYGTLEDDKRNFTLLLKEMRRAFNAAGAQDGKYYMATVAVGAGKDHIDLTEPNIHHQYCDFISLMTYDYRGGWEKVTNHQAALYPNPQDPSPTSPIDQKNTFNADWALRYFNNNLQCACCKT